MDDAAGHGNFVTVIESVQLFEIELAAAKLCVDFLPARIGETVNVKEMAGQKIGVHARAGFVPVKVEGHESFGLGLVRGSKRGEKAKHDNDDSGVDRAVPGWLHERKIPGGWFTGLDESKEREVRAKKEFGSIMGRAGGKDGVVANFGGEGGACPGYFSYEWQAKDLQV